MNIPIPTDEEKNQSIHAILEKGLKKPNSLFAYLKDMYQVLGIRNVFWGTGDCLILVAIATVLISVLFVSAGPWMLYSSLFLIAPIVYMMLLLTTMWKETQSNTIDIKMTCKYTLKHLTAFRILCFSAINIIFNVGISVLVFYVVGNADFIRLLTLSLCALFLYAIGVLLVLIYIHDPRGHIVYSVIWTIANVLMLIILDRNLEMFFNKVSQAIVILVLATSVLIYFMEIKKYLLQENKGVGNYANS